MQYLSFSFILCLFLACDCSAQNTIDAAGGQANGNNGTLSYSVGQVFYQYAQDTAYSIAEGVQQAYEITVINNNKAVEGIPLSYKIYPNPTHSLLHLEIQQPLDKAVAQLYDVRGQYIKSVQLAKGNNKINMHELLPAVYFIKLYADGQVLQTFKVIKH